MNPKTAKKLMEETPEIRDFVAYIKAVIRTLDSIQDIDKTIDYDMALEVRARQLAMKKLSEILTPLLTLQELSPQVDNEYAIDVE